MQYQVRVVICQSFLDSLLCDKTCEITIFIQMISSHKTSQTLSNLLVVKVVVLSNKSQIFFVPEQMHYEHYLPLHQ